MHTVLRFAAFYAAALFLFAMASLPGRAQDVTLTSLDGAILISGDLQAYDGEFFRIETRYGLLTLDAQGVGCEGPGCPDLDTYVAEFTVAGAPTIGARLLPWLLTGFAESQGLELIRQDSPAGQLRYELFAEGRVLPVVRIKLALSSSDAGLLSLMAGEADMALSFSEMRDRDVRMQVLALDAFAPVVAPENDLAGLSLETLPRLLTGEISNWQSLGGPDIPITLHLRGPEAGERQALDALLLAPLELTASGRAVLHHSNAALARAVARDPFALGFTLISSAINARVVPLIGACDIRISATPLAIKAEDYPLTQPLFLHVTARRLPLRARQFLEYAVSPAGQNAVRSAGFIDQATEIVDLDRQGERLVRAVTRVTDDEALAELQRMVTAMQGSARLSSTFRFEPGSAELDAQSRGNLLMLARDLEAGLHDGRELIFVGFTDGDGPLALNLRIARDRAEAVRRAVREAAPLFDESRATLAVDGFGPALPMACDDSDWGRGVNRRVEVWLR